MADADQLLHRLWTKAVGTSDYDKAEWRELERILELRGSEVADAIDELDHRGYYQEELADHRRLLGER